MNNHERPRSVHIQCAFLCTRLFRALTQIGWQGFGHSGGHFLNDRQKPNFSKSPDTATARKKFTRSDTGITDTAICNSTVFDTSCRKFQHLALCHEVHVCHAWPNAGLLETTAGTT